MPIRRRRLHGDYERVVSELSGSEVVSVRVVSGDPPDHYQVKYRLSGIMWDESTESPVSITEHIVDIYLPPGYPRQTPRCVMRTPVWHPNIGDYVCIGDYWSAGLTLVDIVAHIGEMIQYKSYNLRSPVNKSAARWAQRNKQSFPLGTKSVLPPESMLESEQAVVEIELAGDRTSTGPDISLGPVRDRER